jgi:putative membrane protein
VIKEVTGKEVPTAQAASAEYNHIFTSGQWQSGGTKVSFSLPKSFEEATYSKLSASDAHFVKQAAKAGMEEVELGKLAAQKASDPDVKSIAQRIVDDHLKANDQLKQLAAQKGVTLSTDLSVSRTDKAAKLSKLSGTAFDRAYISTVVKGQKKLVADFANTSKTGKDSDIKSFAATILPDLQDHLKMVQGFFRTSSKASKKKSNSDS